MFLSRLSSLGGAYDIAALGTLARFGSAGAYVNGYLFRELSRCFSRLLVPLGGVARMLGLFPHLMLLHMVSDGFHRGGDEGFVPAHEELSAFYRDVFT